MLGEVPRSEAHTLPTAATVPQSEDTLGNRVEMGFMYEKKEELVPSDCAPHAGASAAVLVGVCLCSWNVLEKALWS